jgi:hypothetical protein
VRRALAGTSLLIATAFVLGACTVPAATINVALYGRNLAPVQASFTTQPSTDPPLVVAFARDPGVACWTVPAGSQIVLLDHDPSLGPANAVRVVATIQPGPAGQAFWVDVAADGSITSGEGEPPWWPPGGGGCPAR